MPANDLGREETPQWPDFELPLGSRETVIQFYELVDTESEKAFQQWTDLFVPEGGIEVGRKVVQGHEALLKERRASWDAIAKRAHHVYRIYAMSAEATDLLIIGRVDITVRNGRQFSQEFAQNFLLAKNGDKYMIRKFQAWIDSALLANAIKGD